MVIEVGGRLVVLTEDGFLSNTVDWNQQVAECLAAKEGIVLQEAHWEVIHLLRGYYLRFEHLPNMRIFVKLVEKALGREKGNSRYLHGLFPRGPLKHACKLAGLPKPPHCI